MQRAIDLRDELPTGRRRADLPQWHAWVQIAIASLCFVAGVAILSLTAPVWNWLGAVAMGLGPAMGLLGVVDLARRGDNGKRRVTTIFRTVRLTGLVMNTVMVALEVVMATTAGGLLIAAVAYGEWSPTVSYFLTSALVIAVMGCGLMMMVRIAELPAVSLSPRAWWREMATFRHFTSIAIPVSLVGAAVALSLRDTRAVALAMVGLTTVLLGWVRSDRMATDEAVRRLAAAADTLAQTVRAAVAPPATGPDTHADPALRREIVSALEALDLACYRHLRRGFLPASPRHLVDLELLAVIRACKLALTAQPLEHVTSPLTAGVVRVLRPMKPQELERDLLIFAADVRRLATLAPDRLDTV